MIIFKKNSSVVQCRHQRCNGVDAGVVSNGVDTSDDTRYSSPDFFFRRLDFYYYFCAVVRLTYSYVFRFPSGSSAGWCHGANLCLDEMSSLNEYSLCN